MHFHRVFCTSCIRKFAGDDEVQLVLNTNPWHCYLCSSAVRTTKCLLEARLDWRENLAKLLGPPDAITVCLVVTCSIVLNSTEIDYLCCSKYTKLVHALLIERFFLKECFCQSLLSNHERT